MALEKRTFLGGMSKDVDSRLVKDGDYEEALNVRVASSSDGTIGSVENVEGNEEIPMDFFNPSSDLLYVVDGGIYEEVNPTSVFYRQIIEFHGIEVEGQSYSFNLYSKNQGQSVGINNYSWVGNAQRNATASYLYSQFNPKANPQDIVVYDNSTGFQYVAKVVDLSFSSSSQLSGGVFAITIESTTAGIPFTLDANSLVDSDEYVTTSSLSDIPISSDSSISIDIDSVFETGGIINTDTDGSGVNIGASIPTPGANQTAYKFSISGIEPTTPTASSTLSLFSYSGDKGDGTYDISPVMTFDTTSFDTGGDYELSSSQNSVASFLRSVFLDSSTLVSDDDIPFNFVLAPSNLYFNFTSNTILNDVDLDVTIIGPSGVSFSLALDVSEESLNQKLASGNDVLDSMTLFDGVSTSFTNLNSLSDGSTLTSTSNITELSIRIEELTIELTEAEDALGAVELEFLDKQQALEAALADVEATEASLAQAENDLVAALEAKTLAEGNLSTALTGIGSLLAGAGIVSYDISTTQAALDSVSTTINSLKSDLEIADDGVTQADVDTVQGLLNAANAETQTLEEANAELVATSSDHELSLETLEAEVITDLIESIQLQINNSETVSDLITALNNIDGLTADINNFAEDLNALNTDPSAILTLSKANINTNKDSIDSTYNSLSSLIDDIEISLGSGYTDNFDAPAPDGYLSFRKRLPGETVSVSQEDSYVDSESAYIIQGPARNVYNQASRMTINPLAFSNLSSMPADSTVNISVSLKFIPNKETTLSNDYQTIETSEGLKAFNLNNSDSFAFTESIDYGDISSEGYFIQYRSGDFTGNTDILIQDVSITPTTTIDDLRTECLEKSYELTTSLSNLQNEIVSGNPSLDILFPEGDTPTAFTKLNDYAASVSTLASVVHSSLSSTYGAMSLALSTSQADLTTLQSDYDTEVQALGETIDELNLELTTLNAETESVYDSFSYDEGFTKSVISFWGPEIGLNPEYDPQMDSVSYYMVDNGVSIHPNYTLSSGFQVNSENTLTLLTNEEIISLTENNHSAENNIATYIYNNITSSLTEIPNIGWFEWEWSVEELNGTDSGLGTQKAWVKILNFDNTTTELTDTSPTFNNGNLLSNSQVLLDYEIGSSQLNSLGGLHIIVSYNQNQGGVSNEASYLSGGDFDEFKLSAISGSSSNAAQYMYTSNGLFPLKYYSTLIQTP